MSKEELLLRIEDIFGPDAPREWLDNPVEVLDAVCPYLQRGDILLKDIEKNKSVLEMFMLNKTDGEIALVLIENADASYRLYHYRWEIREAIKQYELTRLTTILKED